MLSNKLLLFDDLCYYMLFFRLLDVVLVIPMTFIISLKLS